MIDDDTSVSHRDWSMLSQQWYKKLVIIVKHPTNASKGRPCLWRRTIAGVIKKLVTPVTINVITISKVDFTIDRVRRSTRSTLRRAHKRMADNAVNRKRKRNLPHKKSTQLDAFVGELERTTSELEKLEKQNWTARKKKLQKKKLQKKILSKSKFPNPYA